MSAYAHKIWAEGKKPLRPKLSNECGWFNNEVGPARTRGKISCLNSSTLTFRTAVQVPRAPEPAPAPVQPPAPEGAILDKNGRAIPNQTVKQMVQKLRPSHQVATQPQQQAYVSVEPTAPSSISPAPTSTPSEVSQPASLDPHQIPGLPPPPPGHL